MQMNERRSAFSEEELARQVGGQLHRKIFDIPPGDPLSNFEVIMKRVNEIPLETDPDRNMSLTALFQDGNSARRVKASTRTHQAGDNNKDDKRPQLIHLPMYDPTGSIGTYRFFDGGDFFQEWKHIRVNSWVNF